MKLLNSLALASLLFPVMAAAQTPATEAPVAKPEVKIEKKITFGGVVQSYFYLMDSQKNAAPYFKGMILDLYPRYSEGIVSAAVDLRLTGNARQKVTAVPSPTAGGTATYIKAANGGITIRKADVTLKLPTDTSISLGRIRPGGATYWGSEQVTGPTGFSGNDGIRVTQTVNLGVVKLDGGVFFGNTTMADPNGGMNANYAWNSDPVAQAKGYIVNVGAKALDGKLSAALYYGITPDMVTNLDDATNLVPEKARTVSHIEASVGYNDEDQGFAGYTWLEMWNFDKSAPVTKNENGKLTLGDKADPKLAITNIGFGGSANSKLLGYTDILQKDGVVYIPASLELFQNRTTPSVDGEKDNDITKITIGAGYSVGSFYTELAFATESTKAESYTKANGTDKAKSANSLLFTMTAAF